MESRQVKSEQRHAGNNEKQAGIQGTVVQREDQVEDSCQVGAYPT